MGFIQCPFILQNNPDSKVHEAYMGPTWGREVPGVPHVGPMDTLSGNWLSFAVIGFGNGFDPVRRQQLSEPVITNCQLDTNNFNEMYVNVHF